ncbi:MAG: ribosome maturation factor RimM [Clostridia bacterium]|nr:ribosome maturation factor RimM [Clostridia bacterium]
MKTNYFIIGEITKPQGVRGELKLRPITCDLGRFEDLETVLMKRGETYVPVNITVNRINDDAVFFNMEGINDRDAAERMRGEFLYVDREHAVELDEDSTFLSDLIGLRGLTDDGRDLGKLNDVMQPGGNDVYVFNGPLGEVLVPALKIVVERVDLEEGVMHLVGARLNEVAVFEDSEAIR